LIIGVGDVVAQVAADDLVALSLEFRRHIDGNAVGDVDAIEKFSENQERSDWVTSARVVFRGSIPGRGVRAFAYASISAG
jgi:hypothetical protein